MLKKLACVIPCFNESKNLPYLCREIEQINEEFIDWFIVNNGSYDVNNKEFENIVRENINLSNVKTFYIKKNTGYGNGIKECILRIINNYEVICWTHADGQTPLTDVKKALMNYETESGIEIIKGIRISRNDGILATIFTMFFNIIILFILNYKSRSPNSQPTLINSKAAKLIIGDAENDANFDISILYLAKLKRFKIQRFPVQFKLRRLGKGANESIMQKLIYSIKTIRFLKNRKF